MVFPTFLQSSLLGRFFTYQVQGNLPLFGFLYGERIYTIVLLSFVLASLVYLIVRICLDSRKRARRLENIVADKVK